MFFSNGQSPKSEQAVSVQIDNFNTIKNVLDEAIKQYLSNQTNLSKEEKKAKEIVFKSLSSNIQLAHMNSNVNDTYHVDRIRNELIPRIKEWGDKDLTEAVETFSNEFISSLSKQKVTPPQ